MSEAQPAWKKKYATSGDGWRVRLRMAIARVRNDEAGMDLTTPSRIPAGTETVVRVVYVCGETVGLALDEYGFSYSRKMDATGKGR